MKHTGARLGVAMSAIGLIVALLAFFSINHGFAWLSGNRDVAAEGIGVRSELGPTVTATLASYGVLSVSSDGVGGVYVAEDKLVDGERAQRFALPIDDPSNIYASEYKKALILALTLENAGAGARYVRVAVRADATPLITGDGNGGYDWETNYLSNAVTFTPATADAAAVNLTKQSGTVAFVDFTGGTPNAKKSEIILFEGTVTGKQTLYFIMEYNHDFIDYLNARLLGAGFFGEVNYTDDIEITVS